MFRPYLSGMMHVDAAGGSSLLTGLQAWWDLPGGNVNQTDDSGNGNTLSPNNTPGQVAGGAPDGENCALLDRPSSEYYSIANGSYSGLSPGSGSVGFNIWVYFTALVDYMALFALYESPTNREWLVRHNGGSGAIDFIVYGATSGEFVVDTGAFSFSINTWYNLSGGIDRANNQIGIAVNAGTLQTTAFTETVESSTSAFGIGAEGDGGQLMNGRLAAGGIWNRIPTASERSLLYNSGNVLRYPF